MHPLQEFDFVELMQAIEPADIFAVTAGFTPKTRRIGAAINRQRTFLDDFVAEEIGERDLGGRYGVQRIRRFVHLPFFIGQLSGGRGARGVYKNGRRNLRVTRLGVFIQKEM